MKEYKEFEGLQRLLKSTDFSTAVIIGISITIPIVVGLLLDRFEIGLALSFGAFWSSPSDVSGRYRHKKFGILFSAALVMLVSLIGGYLHYQTWLPLPILGILSFAIAYISIYGFRASLISFSGLLALVYSLAHESLELKVYQTALLVGAGGLWYLLLMMLWYRINPKTQTEETLSKTFLLTAEFLKTRGKLIGTFNDRNKLQSELYTLQSELMENHEILREILIPPRKNSSRTNYNGNRLLIFIQLVEMLETAIANPVNYDKMDMLFKEYPEYAVIFQELIFNMSDQLRIISMGVNLDRKLPSNNRLESVLEQAQNKISIYGMETKSDQYEKFLILQNFLDYQKKQFQKLKKIKWLLSNPDSEAIELIDWDESRLFIESQNYDPKLLIQKFGFHSDIFKHSLRLAVTLMIGYVLGTVFAFQKPEWILLSIIVIMRPSYGLTKRRSKDRIVGTLIGGVFAAGIVFLVQNPYVYGVIGVVCLVIAFSMVQKNYRASAAFITTSVILIFVITQPGVLSVIKYRVVDTLLGAGLSFVAILFLWPAWEYFDIRQNIKNSVKSNKDFLNQITVYYQSKGTLQTSYKIARKTAFLETSNLSAAFQRMAEEPQSKQRNLDKINELVVLNHTFLSSLASLSTYIQNHPTTKASEMFKTAVDKIDENLSRVLQSLDAIPKEMHAVSENEPFSEEQQNFFHMQSLKFNETNDKQEEREYLEAHLVGEQLRWLLSLSASMIKQTALLKFV